jgi:hypothetical protein
MCIRLMRSQKPELALSVVGRAWVFLCQSSQCLFVAMICLELHVVEAGNASKISSLLLECNVFGIKIEISEHSRSKFCG